jgi:hypothetical protein
LIDQARAQIVLSDVTGCCGSGADYRQELLLLGSAAVSATAGDSRCPDVHGNAFFC